MVTHGSQSGYILASDFWPHTPASNKTLKSAWHQQRNRGRGGRLCFRFGFCFCSARRPIPFMAAMIGISALRSLHPLRPTFLVSATAPPCATFPLTLPRQQHRSSTSPRCRCRCRCQGRGLPHSTPRGATAASSVPSGASSSAAFMASAPDNAALRHRLIAPNSTAGTGDAITGPSGLLPTVSLLPSPFLPFSDSIR
jgi:hypothetical protein